MGQEVVVPEKSVKEQIRDQKRGIDRSKRSLEREKNKWERDKKKMMAEIKKMALKGQHQGAKLWARDVARVTTQVSKMTEFIGQWNAVSMRMTSISSLNELANAMESAGNAITMVSSKLDTGKLANMAKTMAKEDAKLEMKQDMMQDVLDSIGESLDNPEEQDEIYRQVLQDVGLDVEKILPDSNSTNVQQAKVAPNKVAVGVNESEEDSLDAMLKSLQK